MNGASYLGFTVYGCEQEDKFHTIANTSSREVHLTPDGSFDIEHGLRLARDLMIDINRLGLPIANEALDPILELYVEQRVSPDEIADRLHQPPDLVDRICRMVDRNEYKRQQAAPGLRVTSKAFGMGRRFPIAQRFRP